MPMRADHIRVPREALGIMTARTLANSHPTLRALLRPGLDVLDVGCGPGTLTIETARRALPGRVVGLDVNPEMLAAAREASPPGALPNLTFLAGDIREGGWDDEFDLVNAARVLQWIPDAARALTAMVAAARAGGLVVVLDYDHTLARWTDAPAPWTRFYDAFLAWREAGRLDNAIIRRLPGLFEAAGLAEIRVVPQVSAVGADDADFYRSAGMWRLAADSRGRQMVEAGWLTEAGREAAVAAYTVWMQTPGVSLTLHEACILGRRPGGGRPR
jgi:ubiquinone/menaquinone biosynthesis C-methylase UbiE